MWKRTVPAMFSGAVRTRRPIHPSLFLVHPSQMQARVHFRKIRISLLSNGSSCFPQLQKSIKHDPKMASKTAPRRPPGREPRFSRLEVPKSATVQHFSSFFINLAIMEREARQAGERQALQADREHGECRKDRAPEEPTPTRAMRTHRAKPAQQNAKPVGSRWGRCT